MLEKPRHNDSLGFESSLACKLRLCLKKKRKFPVVYTISGCMPINILKFTIVIFLLP